MNIGSAQRIGQVAPRPILLQYGRRDFYIAVLSAYGLRRATGSDATDLKLYDAEHNMRHPDARSDRDAFLGRTLALE